jgi:hypothetical protein
MSDGTLTTLNGTIKMEGEGDTPSVSAVAGAPVESDAAPASKKRKADDGMYTLSSCMCVY